MSYIIHHTDTVDLLPIRVDL